MTITIDPANDVEIEAFQARRSTKAIDLCDRARELAGTFRQLGIEPLTIHAFTGGACVHICEADFLRHFKGQKVTEHCSSYSTTLRTAVDGIEVVCDVPRTWPKHTATEVTL